MREVELYLPFGIASEKLSACLVFSGHTYMGHGNLSSLFVSYWSMCFTTKVFEYTQKIVVKMKRELVSETRLN